MDAQQFEQVMDRQLKMCWALLVDKAKEYADDKDRLHNFTVAAALQGVSPREALGGMLAKHIVSIYDLLNEVECPPTHVWDEKITDAINYLLLLRAITVEEIDKNKKDEVTSDAS